MKEQNPVAWLWNELANILPTQDYLDLQIGYQEQQRRYSRAGKLRQARDDIDLYEQLRTCEASRQAGYRKKIASRKATIARLESED